jgi:hypothetical protein
MNVSLILKQVRSTLLTTLLVVCLFLQPIAFDTARPQTAEANFFGFGGATEFTQVRNTVQNTITSIFSNMNAIANVNNLGIQFSLLNKEFALDGIAFFIAKAALQSITGSLIDWINSGFNGSPAFVQDLERHLMTVADQELARLVFSPEALDLLCSPFKLDVQAALAVNFQNELSDRADYRGAQCSFTDIVDNFENFVAGDFLGGGGMDTFFEVTQNPSQNTALGAYFAAEATISAQIVNAEGKELELIRFGDGFLSFKVCPDPNGPCAIQTPGKVISEALTFQLSTGPRSLIEADEFNEIINALFYALVNQAIQGAGGLLGLSGGGAGGYTSTLRSGGTPYTPSATLDQVFQFQDIDRPNVTVAPAPQSNTPPTVQLDPNTINDIVNGINSGGTTGGGGTSTPPPVADPAAPDPNAFPPSVDNP